MDITDILDFLHSAMRSVGAEVASPWFYLQLGLVLTGAGISIAAGAAIRSRTDLTSLTMGWPAPLRMMLRVLVSYSSTAVFALLMRVTRVVMKELTWPSRSYLLAIAAKLALAWLVIRILTS
ncbi:MAG: mechanosensitive ion channel protein MscS, partial [Bradyrhizobium sp.]|nr:mechanosensitive ion channel protein MscS [Bradyrhizobium sp.]